MVAFIQALLRIFTDALALCLACASGGGRPPASRSPSCIATCNGADQAPLRKLEERLQPNGTRVGVIYNGFGIDKTDEEWTQHAEDPINAPERNASLVPDDAIIQTWDRHTARFLPVTQPRTPTYLVGRYGSRY